MTCNINTMLLQLVTPEKLMHILELLSSRQCFHKNGRVISALTHLGKWPPLLMAWLGHRFLPEGRAGWLVPSFFSSRSTNTVICDVFSQSECLLTS